MFINMHIELEANVCGQIKDPIVTYVSIVSVIFLHFIIKIKHLPL